MLAAVDLGSNSFHMIVARILDDGSLQIVDRIKEMVRLGAGLDNKKYLSDESQIRALDCLNRFSQRIQDLSPENVRVVGTNTLRKAKNSKLFIKKAQKTLGYNIDIISGIEEARLVYLGVSHTIAADEGKRLVIDIGGGSTETIIGKKFTPILMESHYMGCVNMTRKFFSDGYITKKQLKKADIYIRRELERDLIPFAKEGWGQVIGTSGSIRSIASVIHEEGLAEGSKITLTALEQLHKRLISCQHIDKLKFAGLNEERRPVFIGGFVVLHSIVKSLGITEIITSDGALREGLLYDLLGRIKHEDVREITIQRMLERYSIQTDHVNNIAATANNIYKNVADSWKLNKDNYKNLLHWSALLHEIGLTIAHAGYHKHGAYLAKNSDMPGFSFQDQLFLSALIQTQRNKYNIQEFESLPEKYIEPAKKLAIILRLAIILHRNRNDETLPDIDFKADNNSLAVSFPEKWMDSHTLTEADLEDEKNLLAKAGFKLKLK